MRETTIDLSAQKPAKRYAEALFQLIKEKNDEAIFDEIKVFLSAIENNEDLRNFFFHPIVKLEDKKDVLNKILINSRKETTSFISLLLEEKRLDCLDEIEIYLREKINLKNNIIELNLTSAIDLDDDMKNQIKSRFEAKLNSKVKINYIKDESIIGGIVVLIGNTEIDLSVKNKIENFKRI